MSILINKDKLLRGVNMKTINAEELLELYEAPQDPEEIPFWEQFKVPISIVRQNILDMPILDSIVFPQTIGNITYYSSEELIEWIENQQKLTKILEQEGYLKTQHTCSEIWRVPNYKFKL